MLYVLVCVYLCVWVVGSVCMVVWWCVCVESLCVCFSVCISLYVGGCVCVYSVVVFVWVESLCVVLCMWILITFIIKRFTYS